MLTEKNKHSMQTDTCNKERGVLKKAVSEIHIFLSHVNEIQPLKKKKKCPCFGICKGNILLKLKTIKPPYCLVSVSSALRGMLVFLWEEN